MKDDDNISPLIECIKETPIAFTPSEMIVLDELLGKERIQNPHYDKAIDNMLLKINSYQG